MKIIRRLCCTTFLSLQNQVLHKNQGFSLLQKNLSVCSQICSRQKFSICSASSQKSSVQTVQTKPISIQPTRNVYTVSGIASTLWENLNSKRLKHRKYILRSSALRLYLCCVELIDHDEFMREFNLPDTLAAWFRITELHIWMCMVRLSQEGNEGVVLRNFIMEYFWQDLEKKSKKLGQMANAVRVENIQILSEQFKAALFAYDEGLLSDDKVLAGAVWRNLFDKSCNEAQHLDTVVEYIRKQIVHLDRMDSGVIQTAGLFTFLPLTDSPASAERSKQVLMQIAKRV